MNYSLSKRVAPAMLAVILTLIGFVPTRAPADEAAGAPKSTGKCMMWKATSSTATVYLVGSTHLASDAMYPLPREMEEAFDKADTLVVEVNINKVDQQKMMTFVQARGMYAGDETLPKNLKEQTWKDLQEACATLGLPAIGIERMKPWLVSLTIQVLAIQKAGLDAAHGTDKHFLDQADKSGKKIEELETADFQLDLLAGLDAATQEQGLALGLTKIKNMKDDMAALTNAWIAGDAAAIDAQVTKDQKTHPEAAIITQKMIYNRNGPMAAKVEAYLKGNKTVFVVVGCAHVVGDKGIVKILQNDKIAVEQSPATRAARAEK
jgi:hypothetical protein